MIEKLKAFWNKFKGYIGWIVGALGALALLIATIFGKRADTGDGGLLRRREDDIRENTETKIDLGKQRIEQERKEELWRAERDKDKKLHEADEVAKKETERLKKLEQADKDKFKQELEKQLGVKEKGRP